MNTNDTEEKLRLQVEETIEKEWGLFVATTDFMEPLEVQARHAAKAAFRVGYFAGMNFSTLTLAKNLHDVMEKVEKAGK